MYLAFPRTARLSIAYCGLAGFSLLSASCGGGGDSTAPRPQIGSLAISPSAPAPIPAGGTLQLSVTVRDTQGQVMSGQSVTYTTSAPSIAAASDQGLVSAPGAVGGATITALAGGASATVLITVVPGASASVTRTSVDPVNISAGALAGDSVRFVVKDAFGNPRANEVITFAVAAGNGQVSPASTLTDTQGRAATRFRTGTTAGLNTLTATVSGVTPTSFSVTTVPSSVSISSVTPSPITPGATVTINGAGFSATTTENAVTIDGLAATITSASSTQLTLVAPTAPCTPTHQADLEVIVNGANAFAQPTLQTGTLRSLTVGSALLITNQAELGCTELSPASGSYAVSVINTSQAPSAFTPFRFSGATTIPAAAALLAVNPFVLRQSLSAALPRRPATAMETELRDHAVAHRHVLEANRAIYRKFRSRLAASRRISGAARATSPLLRASLGLPTSASASVAAGDTRLFRVIQFSGGSGAADCSNFVEITARIVYVGTKGIVYEDVAAPLHGQMDPYFVRLGQEFDATMYRSDSTYFGDPLVTDIDTDNDQHLNMVFTPAVPASAAGFQTTCDFFPRTQTNPGSNFGENLYADVPTVAGSGYNGNTADYWMSGIRPTIVHEVKHIASDGAHLENNSSGLEEIWLEEGMAMIAMEVWARNSIYQTTWKGNADYNSTLFCDVRPNFPGVCSGKPFVMFGHFSLLYDFLNQPGVYSLFGPVSSNDATYYGSTWSFIRWTADRYASSEVNFLRGITQAVNVFGLANIAGQAGANPEQMLAMWPLSLYLDENAAVAANPDLGFPSWNLRDIFNGMSADFPDIYPKTFPLSAQQVGGSGDFSIDNTGIRGGSFALYDLLAASGNTRAISLTSSSSPTGLRLVIARVQ